MPAHPHDDGERWRLWPRALVGVILVALALLAAWLVLLTTRG
jgi:hypothetical protein